MVWLPDISTVGQIDFSWDFDGEEYEEWLSENEVSNSQESLMEYVSDNVEFELEFLDNDTFHTFDRAYCQYDDILNYEPRIAREVLSQCMESGGGSLETARIFDDEIDVNNPDELNSEAVKLLRHGGYTKDCRGFILSNGVVVYTPVEHNQCTAIYGVKNTFHFIRLGNIRVLPNSIDIGRKPTPEQRRVLYDVINSYRGDRLYLDIMDGGTEASASYVNPNPQYVLGEIDRYFDEGIRPQGRDFYEAKKGRKVNLTESQFKRLFLK